MQMASQVLLNSQMLPNDSAIEMKEFLQAAVRLNFHTQTYNENYLGVKVVHA